MNILLSELPCTIEVCGKKYHINTDFRIWMRFEELLFEKNQSEAIAKAIVLCMKPDVPLKNELPPSLKETVKALCDFYFCRDKSENTPRATCGKTKRIYSFKHDSELIYAAFLQQYGIDLTSCNMHWWKFRALFSALSGDVKICSVMRIRSQNLADVPQGPARSRLARLKAIYALPDFKTDEEKEAELAEALW